MREAIRRVAFEALAPRSFGCETAAADVGPATMLPTTVAGALYVPGFRTDTLPDAVHRALRLVSAASDG